MPKIKLLDIVDVLETYADLYDMFDDNRLVYEALDKVNEELRAIPSVKAIPIEWLEAQLDVFGDGFYDLRLVIKQWEKDNEIN